MGYDRYFQELLERSRRGGGPENVVILSEVGSTNALARAVATHYQNEDERLRPLLLLAFEQTGGRGRQGRSWSSPAGKGAYVTRVIEAADPALLQTLPLLVEVAGERRKIGGILIEALVRPSESSLGIIGFGVNLFHEAEDLPETGTSLRLLGALVGDQTGASLADLTWDLVEAVEAELAHLGDPAYAVESYRPLSIHQPGERIVCRLGDSVIEGTFAGFDETGRLLLDSEGRRIPVAAGEVIEG